MTILPSSRSPLELRTPRWAVLSAALLLLLVSVANAASAEAAPKWRIDSLANTTVQPSGILDYVVQATNVGDAPMDGSKIDLLATLPEGMTALSASLFDPHTEHTYPCFDGTDGVSPPGGAGSVICSNAEPVPTQQQFSSHFQKLSLRVSVAPEASGLLTPDFSVTGGGAPAASTVDPTTVTVDPPRFGIDAFDTGVLDASGEPSTAASAHPAADLTTFLLNTATEPNDPLKGAVYPVEPLRAAAADLPPGLIGNPTSLATCTLAELGNTVAGFAAHPLCLPESQLGTAIVRIKGGPITTNLIGPFPLFNIVPPPGVAARFGFNIIGTVVVLDARVHPRDGYRITVGSANIPDGLAIVGNTIEIWGDPADESHDAERACPDNTYPADAGPTATDPACKTPYTRPEPHLAFLRNPTSCTEAGQGLSTGFSADSWLGSSDQASSLSHQAPGFPYPPSEWGPTVGIEGCEAVPFSPGLTAAPPAGAQAGEPTGLSVDLTMPQQGLEEPEAISESDLRKAVVTLPAGVRLNPSSADGLGACSPAQIGLTTPVGQADARFSDEPASCPDDAKLGTVTIDTPLLDHPIQGAVYLAQQGQNPFGSLTAIYLVASDESSGVVLKLPGRVDLDPNTGQITTSFDDNPQLPFTHLHLELRSGPRAPLTAPGACGTYAVHSTLSGWSGKTVQGESSFTINQGCGQGFNPKLSAGARNPLAGQTSPFSLRLSREDTDQELGGLKLTMPPGLSGYLKGIPYCPDFTLAAISAAPGTGAAQIASPSCPSASQVGTVTVGAGASANPFYTTQGRAYLAGPYKGAPLSLAVVTPAVAGPFDLGSVLVRNALKIDPETAQITAVSDPFPTILYGIPLDLRDVRVDLSRDHFTLNPTSCEPMVIGSTITSTQGATASPSQRFQVSGCDALGLKPKLALKLRGATRRAGNPALTAILTMPQGGANIAAASVALPRSEFLDQAHIKTICTRVQFAADQCPAGSIYGKATATTPILDQPLSGNVYLRSSSHNLPDLVLKLRGPASQPIEIDAVGRIDTFHRGIRTTFETVPDAPLSKVVLEMPGGRKSLLENSTDICRATNRATARFTGHNGKLADFRPALEAKCPKRKSHRHRHKR